MQSLKFNGKGSEYFAIWIVNILLTIITVGLYYPWAKVRNQRYLYANSSLENRNFEYHATGKQLFFGYLIAMGLLLLYIGIQQVSPIGGLFVFLIFFAALPWIILRSLKFNMGVTSFSNVRFRFKGKLSTAYLVYLVLPICAFLSLYLGPIAAAVLGSFLSGLGIIGKIIIVCLILASLCLAFYLFGLIKQKAATFFINGSRYGQGKFNTNLNVAPFIKIALKTLLLFIASFIALLILLAITSFISGTSTSLLATTGDLQDFEKLEGLFKSPLIIASIFSVYIGLIAISIVIFAYSAARQRTYILNNTTLDNKIKLQSTLSARKLAWVSITNLLMVIFTLGLAYPWAKVRMARLYLENTLVDTSVGLEEYVTQKQQAQSSLGDQIGDAFDVGIDIGI